MKSDDEAARESRAQRLREQLKRLKTGIGSTEKGEVPPPSTETPREFVHRRMRELGKAKRRRSKGRKS